MERENTLSLPEACQRLALSWPQVWRLVLTGGLPARKVGNRWVVERRDVDQLARERARELEQRAVPV